MSTTSLLAKQPQQIRADVKRIFALQQARALQLRRSGADERQARIRALRDAVLANAEAIKKAAFEDSRKPGAEVELTEIFPIVAEANDALRHIKRWMKPQRIGATRAMLGTRSHVRYEPRGVSLIISPWNYPANLTFGPLISALAAGCTAIIKPSEVTPNLSAVITRIVEETFAPHDVAVFEGDADVAGALLDLPFDHIFFTGSPQIGKIVMQAAAKNLSSVTLELGGKTPVIVDRDADLDKAARNIVGAKYTNCGQTCIAPDTLYVEESIRAEFIKRLQAQISKVFGQNPGASSDYSRIVNHRHYQRLHALLDDACKKGATVLAGGEVVPEDNYIAPTLLTNLPADARLMQEEIFGPLFPIVGFNDLQSVIDTINRQPKPLALYIYGRDRQRIDLVLTSTSTGGVCINHSVVHFLHTNLPFGGVNNSGIGNAHGLFGFKSFSHERAVLEDRFSSTHLLFPPYTERVKMLIRTSIRWLT